MKKFDHIHRDRGNNSHVSLSLVWVALMVVFTFFLSLLVWGIIGL